MRIGWTMPSWMRVDGQRWMAEAARSENPLPMVWEPELRLLKPILMLGCWFTLPGGTIIGIVYSDAPESLTPPWPPIRPTIYVSTAAASEHIATKIAQYRSLNTAIYFLIKWRATVYDGRYVEGLILFYIYILFYYHRWCVVRESAFVVNMFVELKLKHKWGKYDTRKQRTIISGLHV